MFSDALKVAGRSPDTVERRVGTLRRFLASIHPATIDQATTDDVEAFLRGYSSPATRSAYLSDLRAFYRYACRRRLLFEDPTAALDPIKVPPPLPRPLEPAELARAVMLADDRMRIILLLGALAGLRRSEIAGLWAEDLTESMVRVRKGKGGRSRQVPLHPVLRTELRRYGVAHGPLFPAAQDPSRPISADWLGRIVSRHFEACGIGGSSHRLRHAAATTLAEVAQDPWMIAQFLGHTNLQQSMTYVASSPGRLGAAVEQMPDPRSSVA